MATTLETTFAGLRLRNPVIVGSSGLTDCAAKNKKLYEAGAGALVLKSLFEEQIMMDVAGMDDPSMSPEASDYLHGYVRQHKLGEYLALVRESKQACPIPIIASMNCYDDANWVDFARQIEDAGADAIEVNILVLQADVRYTPGSFEQRHVDILRHIKRTVSLPVIMKLGTNLTNPVALIDQLKANGAAGIVLFNRFYQPDIDIEKMEQTSGSIFSHEDEFPAALRWISIASAAVKQMDYAASGGIHSPEAVVKALLAGAGAVEVCSAIYEQTDAFIGRCTEFLSEWMTRKGMENIEKFKGRLNMHDLKGVNTFERTQFLRYISSYN